jgi:hypothetical protein
MKKIILLQTLLFSSFCAFAQGYKIEKVDSVAKSKSEIYSSTKSFIAQTWNSAQDVIQNDDKENGIIIVKGILREDVYATKLSPDPTKYTYSYTIKFMMKDNKYKIVAEDIFCTSAYCETVKWPKIEISDLPVYPGLWKCSLKEEKYMALIESVKYHLKQVVESYDNSLKTKPVIEDF